MINTETYLIEESDLSLENEYADVTTKRSHFDNKMPQFLSGACGASCQPCPTTFIQVHAIDLVKDGFPINRSIQDSKSLFEEFHEDDFLFLPTNERFNLTHNPITDKDITSASPLHVYLEHSAGLCH